MSANDVDSHFVWVLAANFPETNVLRGKTDTALPEDMRLNIFATSLINSVSKMSAGTLKYILMRRT